MLIGPTMEEVQHRRLAKSVSKSRRLIPEDRRTPCLKCNAPAEKDSMFRSHTFNVTRYCHECGFGWEQTHDGVMSYGDKDDTWHTLPAGLFPVFWEKEVLDEI